MKSDYELENKEYRKSMKSAIGALIYVAILVGGLIAMLSLTSCSTISHNMKVNAEAVNNRKASWRVKHELKRMSRAVVIDTCSLTVKR